MLTATCKECGKSITYRQGDNGVWFDDWQDRHCWEDPNAGSIGHKPDVDTIAQSTELDGLIELDDDLNIDSR